MFPHVLFQANITFINNTAGESGAAIYATDMQRCTYSLFLNNNMSDSNSTVFERSIFQLGDVFNFMYVYM